MILKPGNPWGRIRGKLSLNPEQALRMFDFVMDPDAHGVIFREYTYLDDNLRPHRGTFISNYFPPSNPQTEAQQHQRAKMTAAVTHWHTLTPAEKQAYEERARKLPKPDIMSGFNLHNREMLLST